MTNLWALLPCPILIVILARLASRPERLSRSAALLMWIQLGVTIAVANNGYALSSPEGEHAFLIDSTALVFMILTTFVAAAAFTHAVLFFDRELASEHAPRPAHVAQFFTFAPLFLIAMLVVITADNLGYMWVGMEATTLLSAPLVYYHRSRRSLEATWKYLIICSVGIAFAFFGTAILYSASQQSLAFPNGSLSIQELTLHAKTLPHGLVRLGFIFLLVGYGTKAGLFPLHTWLPDAHSEAPAPASALLSGALLNCALVALWRSTDIVTAAGEGQLVRLTLLPLALATALAAGLFLLKQTDLKRLLAYSSMENVGIMAAAVALHLQTGFTLQAVNHSLAKVALFLLAGNLLQSYGTKSIRSIRGVLQAYPLQGICLLAGAAAVTGTPPFGSFLAEWTILGHAADSGRGAAVVVLLASLAITFIAFSIHAGALLFGERPASPDQRPIRESPSLTATAVPVLLLALSLWLGLALTPRVIAVFGAPL